MRVIDFFNYSLLNDVVFMGLWSGYARKNVFLGVVF